MMLWDSSKGMFYYDVDGHRRYLARTQITPDKRKSYAIKQASVPNIPFTQWTEQDFEPFASPIKDQNGEGACVGFSGTQGHETSRRMQGMSSVLLSCGNLYGQINGQSDNGAVVEDALVAMEKVGQCLNTTIPDLTWQKRKWPNGWQTEASRFKVEIGGEVTTFEEICSLLELREIVCIGIDCGYNFNPNSDGVLPNQQGSGGGHGLPVLGKKLINNQWYLKIPNSWGKNWGLNGWCFMPRSFIDNAGGGHYHIRASSDDPNDTLNPKPIAA